MENIEFATFGGGCFLCLEAVYSRIDGVKAIVPGYAGGKTQHPTYEQVCKGDTGHAEVIQISFDSGETSYEILVEWFWKCHDPTTLNRQGAVIGTQYRSVIFYENEIQKNIAYESKKVISKSKIFENPIVTEISQLPEFFAAEEYHNNYFDNNQNAGYCIYFIKPKLQKLKLE